MIARLWRAALAAAPIRTWATIAAGPFTLAFAIAALLIVWLGPWEAAQQAKQLDIIGWMGLSGLGLQLVVLISMSGVGVNFSAGKDGVKADLGRDEEPNATVTTTTTTAVG
jgi:hypothetical protein